ncbi:hypothetical protein D3C72_1908440 [compost metagenome]
MHESAPAGIDVCKQPLHKFPVLQRLIHDHNISTVKIEHRVVTYRSTPHLAFEIDLNLLTHQ